MNNSEDHELYSRIRSGDEEALRALFYKYFATLCAVANRILQDGLAAEDVAQTVFINFWNKRSSVRIEDSVFAYLRKMVVHEALGVKRKITRRGALDEQRPVAELSHSDVEDQVIGDEMQLQVESAIEALPEQCRKAFKLSRFEDMTYREIANDLGVSVKTVENHIGRALRHLRVSLQQYLQIFL